MTKKAKRPPLGKRIVAGLNDAIAHAKGDATRVVVRAPVRIDVKAIRARQKMSQREFADTYGFSLDSVQNWESGRRYPTGAARVLLLVIDRDPAAVSRALKSSAA
jgi:putative transcriptional regulator